MVLTIIISILFGTILGFFAGGLVAGGSERIVYQCSPDSKKE